METKKYIRHTLISWGAKTTIKKCTKCGLIKEQVNKKMVYSINGKVLTEMISCIE